MRRKCTCCEHSCEPCNLLSARHRTLVHSQMPTCPQAVRCWRHLPSRHHKHGRQSSNVGGPEHWPACMVISVTDCIQRQKLDRHGDPASRCKTCMALHNLAWISMRTLRAAASIALLCTSAAVGTFVSSSSACMASAALMPAMIAAVQCPAGVQPSPRTPFVHFDTQSCAAECADAHLPRKLHA
jgi:hypothetical protein